MPEITEPPELTPIDSNLLELLGIIGEIVARVIALEAK